MPSGLLPALEVDGRLWTESAEIMSLLEVRALLILLCCASVSLPLLPLTCMVLTEMLAYLFTVCTRVADEGLACHRHRMHGVGYWVGTALIDVIWDWHILKEHCGRLAPWQAPS